jgi:LacI family transcriptional regulator
MKFEAVTIKDIAKALHLSTSTVSRALRGSHEISEATRKTVMNYAESVQYKPNPIALSLKEKKSRSIGVLVSEIANTFFSQAINGIESVAHKKGYQVVITQSHESYEREVTALHYLASRSIDGLLVSVSSETQDTSHFSTFYERGLPIVFFDRVAEDIKTHQVLVDNYQGAYDATLHLITNGFRRIAHITHSEHLYHAKERLRGYRQALEDNRIPFYAPYVKKCRHGDKILIELEKSIRELLELKEKPDAIFAISDRLTTGALCVLKKAGLKVPDEMGLAGFSNSDMVDLLDPSLTAVKQPAFEMGALATELLIQLIESKRPITRFETRILKSKLTVRRSTVRIPLA